MTHLISLELLLLIMARWGVPVGACSAELGMVALSRGTVLVSGSGVLLVGDVGTGLGTTRGFLWMQTHTHTHIQTA